METSCPYKQTIAAKLRVSTSSARKEKLLSPAVEGRADQNVSATPSFKVFGVGQRTDSAAGDQSHSRVLICDSPANLLSFWPFLRSHSGEIQYDQLANSAIDHTSSDLIDG